MRSKYFDKNRPELYIILLSLFNFMNYVDRGIIPGAADEFTSFINDNVDTNTPSVYIGLLQSAFIVGFCLASPIFGNLVHHHGPFFLVGVGLSVWVVAVALSGVAFYAKSFTLLVFARVLSGVGESSFQCCAPPWITLNAPAAAKTTWLGVFYTAIPVGTAFGFVFSALVANSVGWQWAFFLEGMVGIPFAMYFFHIDKRFPSVAAGTPHFSQERLMCYKSGDKESLLPPDPRNDDANATSNDDAEEGDVLPRVMRNSSERSQSMSLAHLADTSSPSMLQEAKVVLKYPSYVYITLGYAAQTAALIGLSTFGPALLMGLGFFDSEVDASTTFGAVVSLSGIIGTPLGGIILDKLSTHHSRAPSTGSSSNWSSNTELVISCYVIAAASAFGTAALALVYVMHNKSMFIVFMFIGCLLLFICNAGINLAIMLSVPVCNRAFAMAFSSVIMHCLGDVPSPLIAGLIKDTLAPGCTGDDDSVNTSSECRDDKQGLRLTMLYITLWLIWCTVFFGAAGVINMFSASADVIAAEEAAEKKKTLDGAGRGSSINH